MPLRLHASTSDKRSMSLDHTRKRVLPDWMLCREKVVYNPVSLFTQCLVIAIRTDQHTELLGFHRELEHKEPITCVYGDLCWEVHCRSKSPHTHVHSTLEDWLYAPGCWELSKIQHVYVEKFDYVALSEEEIDEKNKAKLASAWYRNSQQLRDNKARRERCKRRLLF